MTITDLLSAAATQDRERENSRDKLVHPCQNINCIALCWGKWDTCSDCLRRRAGVLEGERMEVVS